MKKALKNVGKVLLVLIIVLAVFVGSVYVYNRIMLNKEEPLMEKPIGQYVEVDGHKMNIYTEGEGDHTLLFLSGSGTAAPVLDFKSLYSLLSDDYKIVVIEKFGYGFSDVVDMERSFETILRQDREALSKAGIEGPFVLCPHSMSGLEAIMWAQDYPEEVEAIIGLDMVVPRTYDNWDFDGTLRYEKLGVLGRKTGFIRFFYADSSLPPSLSEDDKKLYRAIACRIAVNDNVIDEGLVIPEAVKIIDSKPIPDIPMLMFVSNGEGTGSDDWVQIEKDFAAENTNVQMIELDCEHYVHSFEQEKIAEEISVFFQ